MKVDTKEVERLVNGLIEDVILDDSFTSSSRLDEMGLDSLEFIQLLVEVRREFQVDITDSEFSRIETVGDLISLVVERTR